MATPLVFQAKAMSIRLILIAIAVALIATLLVVSFDDNNITKPPKTHEPHQETVMIPIPGGVVGPESFALDGSGGGAYTGVSDGRIIRWQTNESRWFDFAVTSPEREGCEGGGHDNFDMEHICGRPLGLRFNRKTGHLYIADANMGLLVVGPNGGLATPVSREAILVSQILGRPRFFEYISVVIVGLLFWNFNSSGSILQLVFVILSPFLCQ